MTERKAFPLCWPEGWKRTQTRIAARFLKHADQQYNLQGQPVWRRKQSLSVTDAVKRVLGELGRMGVDDWNIIISTNVPLRLDGLPRSDKEPGDPGAAVYWKKCGKAAMRCMAIDQYTRVADNLAAIAATLKAMRAIERHGGAQILERAFLGFAALPEKASQPWREVLGISATEAATWPLIEERFRTLVKIHHPDQGGDRDEFERIVQAREAARLEVAS